ncbi:MAG: molecular chaperone GrpE [Mariniblastus sp.]|jgi:molecular chaperone GrpE
MNTEPEKQLDDAYDPQNPAADPQDPNASEQVDIVFSEETEAAPTIESLQAELADAEKRVLLAHADLENFRRRNRREMQDQLKYASLKLMGDILESSDNLRRAVESYEKDANSDGLVEGVKLVEQQINNVLQNSGCKRIEAVGQPFDPNLHQALQMQPSKEFDNNIVMMDLRAGFQLHDRVIRPSQVFVSTGPAAE